MLKTSKTTSIEGLTKANMLKLNKTYSIEGLTEGHMNLIDSLLSHVRLGNNPEALELCEMLENQGINGTISFVATDDDGDYIQYPTLDIQ